MKKIILGILALVALGTANAQKGLGVQAGANFSNWTGKDVHDAKIKTGFQVGVNYNIPISEQFVVQPGLNYVQNGFKGKLDSLQSKLYLNYLQLPVLFQYRPEIGSGGRLIIGAGPYAALGIGKVKGKLSSGGLTYTEKESWNDAQLKKFDAGAKVVVGYEHATGISLNLNGDFGFMKIQDVSHPAKVRNMAFGATVGYRLK